MTWWFNKRPINIEQAEHIADAIGGLTHDQAKKRAAKLSKKYPHIEWRVAMEFYRDGTAYIVIPFEPNDDALADYSDEDSLPAGRAV